MDDQHQAGPDHGGGSVSEDGPVPLGQRLFDSPFLLLIACIVVMFVFFTGWGVIEIMSLDPAPLP